MMNFPLRSENPTALALGNGAMRNGEYELAVRYYIDTLITAPSLWPIVRGNLRIACARYKDKQKTKRRVSVAVCGWDLAHNAAGRVYTLAKLYQTFADVEIIGSIFPTHGREMWGPIREIEIPQHSFVVDDETQFLAHAVELVKACPFDVVHISKPRAPNIIIAALYKLFWGANVIVDIDDEELAIVGTGPAFDIRELLDARYELPLLKKLAGKEWTQFAVAMVNCFDGVTVSNSALQRRYGGTMVRHARGHEASCITGTLREKARQKLGLRNDDIVVVFVGTPRRHKGLIETARLIERAGRQDVVFLIAGTFADTDLELELKAIRTVNFLFLENQPVARLRELMAVADVHVSMLDEAVEMARYQTPAKLSDVLGAGLPLIGIPTEGTRDILEAVGGAASSFDNLKKLFVEIISEPATRKKMRDRSEKFFNAELSLEVNSRRLQEVLNRIEGRTCDPGYAEALEEVQGRLFQVPLEILLKERRREVPAKIGANVHNASKSADNEVQNRFGNCKQIPLGSRPPAVVVHFFYPEIWREIASYLSKLSSPFDLFVTAPAAIAPSVVQEVLPNFPRARFFFGPNKGMDIVPFLSIIPILENEGYQAACKIQTKKGDGSLAGIWRKVMLETLIGSEENFSLVVEAFRENPQLAAAGPAGTFKSGPALMLGNREKLASVSQLVWGRGLPDSDWGFFAGTMFWVRPSLLRVLAEKVTFSHEELSEEYKKDGGLEHALERALGLAINVADAQLGLLHEKGVELNRCALAVYPGNNTPGISQSGIGDVMRQYVKLEADAQIIRKSSLFNEDNYYLQCPHIAGIGADPVVHYLTVGRFAGASPDGFFDPRAYIDANKDVVGANVEPFVHYITHGAREGRSLSLDPESDRQRRPHLRFAVLNQVLVDWRGLKDRRGTPGLVSIIIPIFNQASLTAQCIASVLRVRTSVSFEVVLVDNGSEHETKQVIDRFQKESSRISVVSNAENLNFALGCNLGFQNARGEYVVFLNNDTTVTDFWLDALIEPLGSPSIVAVQPKLVFPDNTIQCAGVVFSRWSQLGYPLYAGAKPDDPQVNRRRELRAVTAACVALRTTDFANACGFDPLYVNGQEDVDLCLRITDGETRRCLYEPKALVFHHEGKSEGRGKYIQRNRREFARRWASEVLADDEQHYQLDDVPVIDWKFDSRENVDDGVAVYQPVLGSGALRAKSKRPCAMPFLSFATAERAVGRFDLYLPGEKGPCAGRPTVLLCAHASGTHLFGGERSFLDMLDALNGIGFNVVVTVPGLNNGNYVQQLTARAVGVYSFAYSHWTEREKPRTDAVNRFKSVMEFHRVVAVHANTIMLREPFEAAKQLGVLSFMHVRELIGQDRELAQYIGLAPSKILQELGERTDFYIANSTCTARALGEGGKVILAPNIVRLAELNIVNEVNPRRIVFGLISSNIAKKGIYDVVEVARKCKDAAPNAVFALVGPTSGPGHKDIERIAQLVKNGTLPSNIIFPGYKSTPLEAMKEVNVVLSLSHVAESFGRSVAEAMAARRPVIAYDHGALNELVKPGVTGYLAEYRNIDEVSHRVIEMCGNPGMIPLLGEQARNYVGSNFSPPVLEKGLSEAYISGYAGRMDDKYGNRPGIHCSLLAAARKNFDISVDAVFRPVTVIIPVFNAIEETVGCVESVLRYTDLRLTEILIINDGSTDSEVAERLKPYENHPSVRVMENKRNLGYTRTVNRGIELCEIGDVVLLNSDTAVTPGWLFGLRLAASPPNVGTVTAMSNNAGAFSFPIAGLENGPSTVPERLVYARRIIEACKEVGPIELPTGNGFCMYIRRSLIDAIGGFDDRSFPRGYGEENDFCMRGLKKGFKNILSPWSYVYHKRSASFGTEKARLVKEGELSLARLHPEYGDLVRKAFSGDQIRTLRRYAEIAVV